MTRALKGAARRQAKNRWFKKAAGNRGARGAQWRKMREAVTRGGVFATRDRKLKKRSFRQLWITRLSAAVRARGLSYSRFIEGLKNANISLNRKMLSQLAIEDPKAFDAVVAMVKV